jgi:hypothetical protein
LALVTPAMAQETIDVEITVASYIALDLPGCTTIAFTAGIPGAENGESCPFTVVANVDHTVNVSSPQTGTLTNNPAGDHNSWVLAAHETEAGAILGFRPQVFYNAAAPGGGVERWWNDGTPDAIQFAGVPGTWNHTLAAYAEHTKTHDGEIAVPGLYKADLDITVSP